MKLFKLLFPETGVEFDVIFGLIYWRIVFIASCFSSSVPFVRFRDCSACLTLTDEEEMSLRILIQLARKLLFLLQLRLSLHVTEVAFCVAEEQALRLQIVSASVQGSLLRHLKQPF